MSQNDPKQSSNTDEQLLANAIPIDPSMLQNDEPDLDADVVELNENHLEGSSIMTSTKIRTFGSKGLKDDPSQKWKRKPNVTGKGAVHVKTFVTKLRLDAIDHLDDQINEWLDDHGYEAKFVTSTVGKLVGKISEDALFVNVWV